MKKHDADKTICVDITILNEKDEEEEIQIVLLHTNAQALLRELFDIYTTA